MPDTTANGVRLFCTLTSNAGLPLVLIHGSWTDHSDWDLVAPIFAEHFRLLTYDRRGHSQSERIPGQGSVNEDAADLEALLEDLGLVPAHIVGLSFGGSIALRLATRRPDLFRSLSVHEPPLFDLLAGDPDQGPAMREVMSRLQPVAALLKAGEVEEGARQFIETIALGPGAWEHLPPHVRQLLASNAPTFLDEMGDPQALTVDLAALAAFSRPVQLTGGDQSPAWFAPIVAKLSTVLPCAETRVFTGAGHLPMVTHPAEYAAAIIAFVGAVGDDLSTRSPVETGQLVQSSNV